MSEARSTLVLAAVFFALILATLGSRADWAADEHLYLAGGQVMVEGGSLLVPAYHTGQPRYMKPPLYYWLVWLFMLALGTSLFAARLPALLSGMVVLYFTWRIASEGGRWPRDGAMAVAALAGSYLFLYHSRAAVTDMTMTAGIVGGLCLLLEHLQGRRGVLTLYLAAAALGLSCMAKGPVALILAFGVAALFYILPGRPKLPNLRPSLHWLGALSLLAVVGFWWYAAMWVTQGQAFLQHQVDAEVVGRTRASAAGRLGNLAWYAGKFLTAGLPWTLAAVWAIVSGVRPLESAARRLAWCACLATVVFYGLAINWRASRYLVPLAPFLAVIVGGYLGAAGSRSNRGGTVGVLRLSTAAISGISAVLLATTWAAARSDLSIGQATAFFSAAALAAGLSVWLMRRRMTALGTVLICSVSLAFLLTVPNLLVKGLVRGDAMAAIARVTHGLAAGQAISDQGLDNRESALLYALGKRGRVRVGQAAREGDLLVLKGEQPPPSGTCEVLEVFDGPVRRGVPHGLRSDLPGLLARGDLLRRLPRTRYYLVRPRPHEAGKEVGPGSRSLSENLSQAPKFG